VKKRTPQKEKKWGVKISSIVGGEWGKKVGKKRGEETPSNEKIDIIKKVFVVVHLKNKATGFRELGANKRKKKKHGGKKKTP